MLKGSLMDESVDRYGIGRREFEGFRRLIHDVSGINLGESKDALLAARVARRMRTLGISDHAEYLDLIVNDCSGEETCELIDAISTNVTSFFREPEHFNMLAAHLRQLAEIGVTEVRLWSAACATGEEPYTMAMVAAEALGGYSVRVRILATDISGAALDAARAGVYRADKVRTVPPAYSRYLRRTRSGEYEVTQQVRSMVTFARINLSVSPFPMTGPFDTVMCRNVMIYFAKPTRERLIAEVERLLAPGGLMMLGHAESLAGIPSAMVARAPAAYQKPGRRC